jgi:hypothetical protein
LTHLLDEQLRQLGFVLDEQYGHFSRPPTRNASRRRLPPTQSAAHSARASGLRRLSLVQDAGR